MRRDKRGFAPIAVIVLIVVGVAILGGVFFYFHKTSAPVKPLTPIVATSTTPTSTTTSTTYLSPASGSVGTVVTIHGSGFAKTGNTVLIDGMVAVSLESISSSDGNTLTFTMPQTLGPVCKSEMCAQYLVEVTPKAYSVSVVSNNVTQDIGSFTVTGTPLSPPTTSYRSYLTPSSGPVGTVVTIHASGFAPTGNTITFNGMVAPSMSNVSSPDGKTLTFTAPSSLGPNCKPDQACPMYLILVSDSSYQVNVITNGVTQDIGSFTVTGGGFVMPTSSSVSASTSASASASAQ